MPTSERRRFICPECHEESNTLDYSVPVAGSESGYYDIESESHEYDSSDTDVDGDRTYRCPNCDHEFNDLEEAIAYIGIAEAEVATTETTPMTQPEIQGGESIAEGADNVRIVGIKNDNTRDSVQKTNATACPHCKTINMVAQNGRGNVICTKCFTEYEVKANEDGTFALFVEEVLRDRVYTPAGAPLITWNDADDL